LKSPVLWYTFENDEAKSLLASENEATREAIRFEEKLILAENPIEDKLILAPDIEVKQIHLYDMYGKLIKISTIENNSIDVSFLSAGIYYLSVNNEQVIKIIKL
jgi:hypothetical protein